MSCTLDAFLLSWPFDPWLCLALLLSAWIYWRGWSDLRRRNPTPQPPPRSGEGEPERTDRVFPAPPLRFGEGVGGWGRWHRGQAAAFLGGLTAIFLALASPIEPFASLLLQVHMLQHLLLMMVAPPLLWLGEPLFPLLRGLPRPVRTYWIGPLFRSPVLGGLFRRLTHPLCALLVFTATTWLWHAPAVYDLAVREGGWWHHLQHCCFLASALLFWYPVVRPYPCRPRWSLWLLLPYLLLADVQNTLLSALLTFSDRVLYPFYNEVPRLGGLSALDDQSAAGVLMWVPGSLVFLIPLFRIALRLLYDSPQRQQGSSSPQRQQGSLLAAGRISLPLVPSSPTPAWDLLHVPVLGRFLRWRHARLAMQLPLALLATVLIYDGLRGPQVGPMNLASVLPWIHWRGLVILALLVGGNLFCMTCPFLLPRTLARRWLPAGRSWPRPLRSKWLAVALLILFLWAYEAFSLWNSPWLTAWISVAYFVAAFVIDGFFRGAAFCKYLCPIGQFNFVQSLASPLEVKVRDPEVCTRCRTKDCIRGRDGIPGCELHLYQPRKQGNMDCTFCLDCVHACPHDNVGIIAGPPGRGLWSDVFRSGVGHFGKRPDLAALVVVLVFGAFANAAGMVGPVAELQDRFQSLLGQRSSLPGVTLYYVAALLLLPLLAVGTAAVLSRSWGRLTGNWLEVATRFSYALVPLGFGMWLAHYSFHFLTSCDTAVPTAQRFAADAGWGIGEPAWLASCCRPVAEWLPRLEILFLDVGLLLSLYVAYRIAFVAAGLQPPEATAPTKALLPWAVLLVLLFATGVWIILQPMQMRGTMPG